MAITFDDIDKLGEAYFDVYLYDYSDGGGSEDCNDHEEPTEEFVSFGNVRDIIDTMDSTCDGLGYDVADMGVVIGYRYVCDLVYAYKPSGPGDFHIVCDEDSYGRLVEELNDVRGR